MCPFLLASNQVAHGFPLHELDFDKKQPDFGTLLAIPPSFQQSHQGGRSFLCGSPVAGWPLR